MTEQAQSFPGAFCETCNKWRKPSALMADGSCPRCRDVIDEERAALHAEITENPDGPTAQAVPKIPWHFWVMVAATVLYLGWRLIQGIGALF